MKSPLKFKDFHDEVIICPKHSESVLGWNGKRFAIIYRSSHDSKYYVEQNNDDFSPIYWCSLPKFKIV